jgi:serine/threonine protein kinase
MCIMFKIGQNFTIRCQVAILKLLGQHRSDHHPHVVTMLGQFKSSKSRQFCEPLSGVTPPAIIFPLSDLDLGVLMKNRTFMDGRGPLNVLTARACTAQVATALAFLHYHSVIHRDLKPSNILVFLNDACAQSDLLRTKSLRPCSMMVAVPMTFQVADLGCARQLPRCAVADLAQGSLGQLPKRAVRDGPLDSAKFKNGLAAHDAQAKMTANICTPNYRAPELFRPQLPGKKVCSQLTYGVEVDVWSFGLTVWEMLRGVPISYAHGGAELLRDFMTVLGAPSPTERGQLPYAQSEEWGSLWSAAQALLRKDAPVLQSCKGLEYDVVRQLLQWNPAARATASGILEMPWFRDDIVAAPQDPTHFRELFLIR